jgi:hypothetical protein
VQKEAHLQCENAISDNWQGLLQKLLFYPSRNLEGPHGLENGSDAVPFETHFWPAGYPFHVRIVLDVIFPAQAHLICT